MLRSRKPIRIRPGRTAGRVASPSVASLGLASLYLSVSLSSCAEAGDPGAWAGVVDTLPGGVVRVQNPEAGAWDSATAWRLTEVLRIGSLEGTGPDVFGSISALVVDDLDRIYVLDRHAKEVRVFGDDGLPVRTLGGEGEGPGELKDPVGLALEGGDRLWVVDPGNARYTAFDTAGALVTSRRRMLAGYAVPWRGGFDDRGRLYEATTATGAERSGRALIVHDTSFAPVDTAWVPEYEQDEFELTTENFRMTAEVPFSSGQTWTPAPDGTLWTGITGDYRIAHLTWRGDTLRVIQKEYSPLPVTADQRTKAVERLEWFTRQGGRVDRSRIPDTKPAFTTLHVTRDGHLWVVPTLPPDYEGSAFEVFDPVGRYLGRLEVGMRLMPSPPPVFHGDAVYFHHRGELDVPYVVKFRLERPGG